MPKLCSFGCAPSVSKVVVGGMTAHSPLHHWNKLICDIHFTPEDRVRNNRLKAYEIPSLHLHEKPARVSDIGCCQPSTSHASNTDIVKKEKTMDSEGNPTLSVRKNPEINSLQIEEKQNSTGVPIIDQTGQNYSAVIKTTYPVRKRTDYIRREAVMRIKHLEYKKKMEMQILKTKLEVQMIKRKSALLEEERNKILLQKAKIEFEKLKKSILT